MRLIRHRITPACALLLAMLLALLPMAHAVDAREYALGSGDVVRVTVFQNPDLTVETRVTENGSIQLPAWTTLDLATHYDTRIQGTRTQWTLAIDNLADRRYWRESPKQYGHYYLYAGAPRTLRVAVKASF